MSKRFQQSDFWCDFKCAHGWKKINHNNINVLVRGFKKGPVSFSLAYVPLAPESTEKDCELSADSASIGFEYLKNVKNLSSKLKEKLPSDTMCIRWDFPFGFSTAEERDRYLKSFNSLAKAADFNIKKASVDVQPPDSTFLDLTKSEKELLAAMKSKWRYNLNLAKRKGVTVRAVTCDSPDFEKDLESFYRLYKTTAARDGIGLHPKSYYEDLLKRGVVSTGSVAAENNTKITLYIGSHEGDDLAAIITLFQNDEAIYLYGCSGNLKRNLMPAYLVQWTAICDAKQFGSKIYDFYGIPPTGEEGHPMHGLYLFKTGFGGPEVHRGGSFDVPLTGMYKLYSMAEKLRAFWHKKVMKKIRGR